MTSKHPAAERLPPGPAATPAADWPAWLRAGIGAAFLLLLAAVVAFALLAQRALHREEQIREVGRHMGRFTLVDQHGGPATEADLAGRRAVASFVFTGCARTCLQVSARMREVQARTADLADVRLVSFTVDPRTDTPEVLREFGEMQGVDFRRWRLLTGAAPEVDAVLARLLDRLPAGAWSDMPGGFLRTERILVLDGQGRVRASVDGMGRHATDEVLAALAALRAAP